MTASPRPALIIAAAAAGSFLLALTQSIPVPVLPQIAEQLGASTTTVGWVTTATLLSASALTPVLGRLGHIIGIKPVFVGALVLTLLGSVLAATVHDISALIIGRVLQGASFGLFPLGISLLRHELPTRRLTNAMAVVASTLGVGGGVALVAAGLLTRGGADYTSIFWLCAVLGAVTLGLALTLPHRRGEGGHLDLVGAGILSVSLVCLLLPISQGHIWGWGSPRVAALVVAAVAAMALFLFHERRTAAPLISIDMLKRRPVLITNLAAMAVGFAMFALQLATSYFVQSPRDETGFGFTASALATSLVFLLPGALVSIFVGPLAGRLVTRIGPRNVLALACILAAFSSTSLALLHQNKTEVIVGFVLVSVAIAAAYSAMPALLISYVDHAETAVASSVNSIMRTIGGTIGSALVITILAAQTQQVGAAALPTQNAFRLSYLLAAGVFTVGAVLILTFLSGKGPADPATTEDAQVDLEPHSAAVPA